MQLQRGQRTPVSAMTPDTQLSFHLEIEGIEASALRSFGVLLNGQEYMAFDRGIVADTAPESACGSMAWSPDGQGGVHIDLSRVPVAVERITFGVGFVEPRGGALITTRDIVSGALIVRNAGNTEVGRYTFQGSDFEGESAIRFVDIYRKDGWRMQVVSAGFLGGVPAMLGRFRVPVGIVQTITSHNRLVVHTQRDQTVRVPNAWPGGVQPSIPGGIAGAVGLLLLELADGHTATGTGFFINPGGYLVTCEHVVNGAAKILFCANGDTLFRECSVIRADPNTDLAIVYANDQQGSPSWLQLTQPTDEPRLGQDIGLLGFPLGARLGRDISYSQGIVNSVRKGDHSNSVLQIDAGAAPGSSGSPVFDRQTGRVVGVLSSGLRMEGSGMLINFAADTRQLWKPEWGLTSNGQTT
jgi:S1-C subfamily serine protease